MFALLLFAAAAEAPLPDPVALAAVAREALLAALPERHESLKDWGRTKERFDFKHRGGLTFERRTKAVNHGLWKKYAVEPIAPRERLELKLANVVRKPGGVVTFTAAVEAPLSAEATVQSWSYGVKLLGLAAQADGVATAELDCEVKMASRLRGFALEFVCEPKVLACRVGLRDFKLRKLGALPQALAREIEDEAAKLIRKQLEAQNPKLVAKANAALLKKHPDGKVVWSPFDGLLR